MTENFFYRNRYVIRWKYTNCAGGTTVNVSFSGYFRVVRGEVQEDSQRYPTLCRMNYELRSSLDTSFFCMISRFSSCSWARTLEVSIGFTDYR